MSVSYTFGIVIVMLKTKNPATFHFTCSPKQNEYNTFTTNNMTIKKYHVFLLKTPIKYSIP